MNRNLAKMKYTLSHKKEFLRVERELLGHNTTRGLLHDSGKLLLLLFLPEKIVHNIHCKFARHHELRAHTQKDFIEMIIDWECARFTKPDKPLNARETLYKYYPHLADSIEPLLKKYKL